MAFIEVVNSRGQKQVVPEHWLDHPKLGNGLRRSKRRASQSPSGTRAGKADTSSANTDTAPSADKEG